MLLAQEELPVLNGEARLVFHAFAVVGVHVFRRPVPDGLTDGFSRVVEGPIRRPVFIVYYPVVHVSYSDVEASHDVGVVGFNLCVHFRVLPVVPVERLTDHSSDGVFPVVCVQITLMDVVGITQGSKVVN